MLTSTAKRRLVNFAFFVCIYFSLSLSLSLRFKLLSPSGVNFWQNSFDIALKQIEKGPISGTRLCWLQKTTFSLLIEVQSHKKVLPHVRSTLHCGIDQLRKCARWHRVKRSFFPLAHFSAVFPVIDLNLTLIFSFIFPEKWLTLSCNQVLFRNRY